MPIREEFLTLAFYRLIFFNGVRIAFIVLLAWLATLIAGRTIRGIRKYAVRVMLKAGGGTEFEVQKRADTVSGVVRKTLAGFVWIIAAIMILKELDFDVRPLLAGAGVIGVAVGFGAQNVVKDVLAGFFLLLENQIRFNDIAVINGTGGLVEEINLRTTVLRSEDGAVHVFPNGGISKISNLTRDFSYYVFNVSVNYNEDTDHVVDVLTEIAAGLMTEDAYRNAILAPLEVMGVDQLADSAVVIKARFKTLPMKQWLIGREMNRRIKKRFAEAGIDIPYPTRTVHLQPLETTSVSR